MPSQKKLNTQKTALFTVLVALCTAIQIMPRPVGLEFTSLLTFCAGAVFGSLLGATFGAMVMFVNAFLSPWGFAGLNMPLQMLGMGIIGTVGGFYKIKNSNNTELHVGSAVLGAFLTFIYYLIANLGFAVYLTSGIPSFEAIVLAQVYGAFFTLIYTVSNTFLFGVGVAPIVKTMQKLLRTPIQNNCKSLEERK
jgi:uncharacterized membrane protein